MQPSHRKALIGLAVFAWVLVWVLFAYRNVIQTGYTDFDVYYRTGSRLLSGELASVYNLAEDGNSPFRYAPWTLPYFAPWAMLPPTLSRVLWFCSQMLAFTAAFWIFSSQFGAKARVASAVALLLVLRFVIDHGMINQITGLMALGYAFLFRSIVTKRELVSGAGAFLPFSFKIGGAFSLGQLPIREWPRAGLMLLLCVLACSGVTSFIYGFEVFRLWFTEWVALLGADSAFFDSAHYGSQSLNSALQRAALWLGLDKSDGLTLHRLIAIPVLLLTVHTWQRFPAKDLGAQGIHFALGVMAYLVLMPFTFKYSLPLLFFALLPWLLTPFKTLDRVLLTAIVLTMSLAGLDIVGAQLFSTIQKLSLPAICLLLLYARLLWLARRTD